RQIVRQAVVHGLAVAFAPHLRGLHPFRPVRRAVLFIKKFAFHAVGISLHCQWAIFQVRQKQWGYADVIVNYLSLGEAGLWVKDLVEVGYRQLLSFNDELRFYEIYLNVQRTSFNVKYRIKK